MKLIPLLAAVPIFLLSLQSSAADSTRDTVHLGLVPVSDVAPIYIGIKQGFFDAKGIDIVTTTGQGGPAMIAGVMSGKVNIGISASVPLIQAASAGFEPVVLSMARQNSLHVQDSAVVVSGNSPIKQPSDLNNKVIAVNGLRSINELLIRADIDKAGGDSRTLKFIELPFPDMAAALGSGRVDAVAAAEPFLSTMKNEGSRILMPYVSDTIPDGGGITYWFTSKQQLEEKPELFNRFREAYAASVAQANQHPDSVREALLSYTRLKHEQVATLPVPVYGGELKLSDFNTQYGYMKQYGFLKKEVDLHSLIPADVISAKGIK